MGNVIEVRRENMRVEFQDLEDHESLIKIKKWAGVWSASFSFYRKIVFAGRELNAWSHWFSMPTKLKLETSADQVKACGEIFLNAFEEYKHLLPKENKDFGPNAKLNVDPLLMKRLTAIADGIA